MHKELEAAYETKLEKENELDAELKKIKNSEELLFNTYKEKKSDLDRVSAEKITLKKSWDNEITNSGLAKDKVTEQKKKV